MQLSYTWRPMKFVRYIFLWPTNITIYNDDNLTWKCLPKAFVRIYYTPLTNNVTLYQIWRQEPISYNHFLPYFLFQIVIFSLWNSSPKIVHVYFFKPSEICMNNCVATNKRTFGLYSLKFSINFRTKDEKTFVKEFHIIKSIQYT